MLSARTSYLCLILLMISIVSKAKPIDLKEGDVSSQFQYLIDSTRKYSISDVRQLADTDYLIANSRIVNINTDYPIWVKLIIENTSDDTYLVFNNPVTDSIVLYNEERVEYQGESVKSANKNYNTLLPVFKIPANKHKVICWIKITNPSSPTTLDWQVGSGGNVFRKMDMRILIMSGFFFLMLIVFIFNIVLYASTKSNMVLTFGLFNFSTLLFISTISGLNVFMPYEIAYYVNPYAIIVVCMLTMSGIVMSINILSIRKNFPVIYSILLVAFSVIVLCVLLVLFGEQVLASKIANPLGGLIIPIYIFASYKAYRQGQTHALYYLIGWVVYYIVGVILILAFFAMIPSREYLYYLTPSVSIIDFFLISATVISKINKYRIEKERAEKEQFLMIQNQNNFLEKRVEERTRELQFLNEEIATQNEELQSQKDHISILNDSLEKKVGQRTTELQNAMTSLQLRNKDLESFSYVVSHNLRGPISTLLGLAQIFNIEKPEDPSNRDVMQYAQKAVLDLDRVIQDLNYIISVKSTGEEIIEKIDLEEILKLTLGLLDKEIVLSNAKIETDFSRSPELTSVPTYLQNIFYNILSNSIKYTKNNQSPLIQISSYKEDGYVLLSFSDKGIGMNLPQVKEKIFKMFQRFDKTKEGRGIGLYLVKSQIDLLNGTIEVESSLGVGTTFTVRLPE
jgi:signal transduction histidine kinase